MPRIRGRQLDTVRHRADALKDREGAAVAGFEFITTSLPWQMAATNPHFVADLKLHIAMMCIVLERLCPLCAQDVVIWYVLGLSAAGAGARSGSGDTGIGRSGRGSRSGKRAPSVGPASIFPNASFENSIWEAMLEPGSVPCPGLDPSALFGSGPPSAAGDSREPSHRGRGNFPASSAVTKLTTILRGLGTRRGGP